MEKLNTKKTILIMFSGRAGVGKTTAAKLLRNYLEDRYSGLKVGLYPFANRLKTLCMMAGWDGIKDQRGRTLLQNFGQVCRAYDKDIWVKGTIDSIEDNPKYPYDIILIDDWRFPNELEYIKNCPLYSVVKVRIESPNREILRGTPQYSEESETALLDYHSYDYTIFNLGDLITYREQVINLWEFILELKQQEIK